MDVGLVPQVVAALQVVTSRAQSVLEKRETPLLPPRVSPLEVAERGLIVATNLCLEQPLRARLATDSAFVSSLVDLLSVCV